MAMSHFDSSQPWDGPPIRRQDSSLQRKPVVPLSVVLLVLWPSSSFQTVRSEPILRGGITRPWFKYVLKQHTTYTKQHIMLHAPLRQGLGVSQSPLHCITHCLPKTITAAILRF